MVRIVPQMRILVAIEAVDGRKGIDSLARLCQENLQVDPFSVFNNRGSPLHTSGNLSYQIQDTRRPPAEMRLNQLRLRR